MTALALRTPTLEWTWHAATGRTQGLGWVDTTLVDVSRPFVVVEVGDTVRFRHVPYGGFVPPTMLLAAQQAEREGRVTALHGVQTMFARSEWHVATRQHMWTSVSSVPPLLPDLVESYGLEQDLHRGQSDTLSVLLAHAPQWYPRRGHADRALDLLASAELPIHAAVAPADAPQDELFACHDAAWWRTHGRTHSTLHIHHGAAVVPALDRPDPSSEDVVLTLPEGQTFPHELLRLLPAWATVRLLSTVAP